jgi:hypothetical protein
VPRRKPHRRVGTRSHRSRGSRRRPGGRQSVSRAGGRARGGNSCHSSSSKSNISMVSVAPFDAAADDVDPSVDADHAWHCPAHTHGGDGLPPVVWAIRVVSLDVVEDTAVVPTTDRVQLSPDPVILCRARGMFIEAISAQVPGDGSGSYAKTLSPMSPPPARRTPALAPTSPPRAMFNDGRVSHTGSVIGRSLLELVERRHRAGAISSGSCVESDPDDPGRPWRCRRTGWPKQNGTPKSAKLDRRAGKDLCGAAATSTHRDHHSVNEFPLTCPIVAQL